jgi:hypothetical protein
MENILTFESFINEAYNKPRAGGQLNIKRK